MRLYTHTVLSFNNMPSINQFWENGEVFLNFSTFCCYLDFLDIFSLSDMYFGIFPFQYCLLLTLFIMQWWVKQFFPKSVIPSFVNRERVPGPVNLKRKILSFFRIRDIDVMKQQPPFHIIHPINDSGICEKRVCFWS